MSLGVWKKTWTLKKRERDRPAKQTHRLNRLGVYFATRPSSRSQIIRHDKYRTINIQRDEYAMRQPLLQLCSIKLRNNVDEQNMRGFPAIVQLNLDICLLHLKRVSVSNRFLDLSGFHVSHICCQRANNFAYNIYFIKSYT